MTVKELQEIVNKAVADGHGDARVMFDAEARAFHCHYVDVDNAMVDDGKESGMGAILGLYTQFHLYPPTIENA